MEPESARNGKCLFYSDRRSPDRHLRKSWPTKPDPPTSDFHFQIVNGLEAQYETWRFRRGSRQSEGEWYSRGYLPHRDRIDLIQHVTIHLADSLPREAVERVELSIKLLPEAQRVRERRARLHNLIDAGYGCCILRNPEIADMVQNSLLYFQNKRYHLHAWVVMPNHFHVLFEPINEWSMSSIVTSWKKYTARRIRRYLSNAGLETGDPDRADHTEKTPEGYDHESLLNIRDSKYFWNREFWDRYIRDEEHYWNTVEYIHNNPVKARLVKAPEDWPWSSVGRKTEG